MIGVVVADSQPMFLDALARVVHQDRDLRLVGELGCGLETLALLREHRPAVAVVARVLPGLGGEGLLAAVKRDDLPTRIVVLDPAPATVVWSLVAGGAAGVLSSRSTDAEMRAAVHQVAAGGTALCPEAQGALAGEVRAREAAEGPLLSTREHEVLRLVARSLTLREIAERLLIARSTVKTHYEHLLVKLDARDRVQLVLQAQRRHLLDE